MSDNQKSCEHLDIKAHVHMRRAESGEGGKTHFAANIKIWCGKCGQLFAFKGVKEGLDPFVPTCGPNGFELHVPIQPAPIETEKLPDITNILDILDK